MEVRILPLVPYHFRTMDSMSAFEALDTGSNPVSGAIPLSSNDRTGDFESSNVGLSPTWGTKSSGLISQP